MLAWPYPTSDPDTDRSHMQVLVIYKLGFNRNYYTFASILLIRIVLCGKFPRNKCMNYECFHMRIEHQQRHHLLLAWPYPSLDPDTDRSHMKRELSQNLSGNEVYYTACS